MSNNNDLHTFPIHSIMSLIIPFHHYLLLIDLKKMCEYQLIHLNTPFIQFLSTKIEAFITEYNMFNKKFA